MTIRTLAAAGLLLLAAPLAAQDFSGLPDALVPDRPDFTEGTSIVPVGHYQIEGGATYARSGDAKGTSLGELLVRIGTGERWETRLGVGSYSWIDSGVRGEDKASGYEDPFVEVKVRLTEADPNLLAPGRPVVALVLGTSIPAGSGDLTADEWQPAAIFAFDWDFTDRFSLGANLGYAYPADGDERFSQGFASVSAGFSVTDRLGVYLETYGFNKEDLDGSSTQYVDTGASWLLSNDISLDVHFGAGFDDPRPNWYFGLGGAIRF
ncbi:MAG: transporter [Thermoanaerobaculia bacterium]